MVQFLKFLFPIKVLRIKPSYLLTLEGSYYCIIVRESVALIESLIKNKNLI